MLGGLFSRTIQKVLEKSDLLCTFTLTFTLTSNSYPKGLQTVIYGWATRGALESSEMKCKIVWNSIHVCFYSSTVNIYQCDPNKQKLFGSSIIKKINKKLTVLRPKSLRNFVLYITAIFHFFHKINT